MSPPSSTVPLSSNWSFRQQPSGTPGSCAVAVPDFLPARSLPTEIHLDLLSHGLIPDPFLKQNETLVQWVGEEQWVYRTSFRSPSTSSARHVLVFEGLDTFATVKLNGAIILESENMFIPHRVDVTSSLAAADNELEILFDSAFIRGKMIREKYPDFKWGCWNGDPSRLAVRKAQYHYGWDWGPMLMTCGPWKPVYLETYTTRVAGLGFVVDVADGLESAKITVTAEVEGPGEKVVFRLVAPDEGIRAAVADVQDGKAVACFGVESPDLWFPHGYGEQPLYTLSATADEGSPVKKRFGIRRARVVQRELVDSEGLSFFFEINNIPIWAGGSNWIPADNFLTRLDEGKYRRWLDLLKDANQIMVRVWGGGIYEADCFYDICDEYGILVWQDFAFGCGNYPAMIPEFRKSVEKEAITAVTRLRHHPSIVIYAGNNEDYAYMMSQEYHLGYDPEDTNPQNWLITQFPARYIYEKILPDVVAKYSPGTDYHRGSPYGTSAQPGGADNKHGDMHQWNVWHGTQEPYQNYKNLSGRFVSEFGMEGFPALSTINYYLSDSPQSERHPFSDTVEFHNKADGAERRIALYISENIIPNISSLEGYIYSTQLIQSEALSAAYVAWRRNWKGPGKEYNAGALVWQINDCWPVTSWAIVDYFYNPKPAYYSIKRALAPITIAAERTVIKTPQTPHTSAHITVSTHLQVWASNFTLTSTSPLDLTISTFDISTGSPLTTQTHPNIILPPNRSTDLFDIPLLFPHAIVALNLTHHSRTIARFVSWPEPLKHLTFAKNPVVKVRCGNNAVFVSVDKPVKGLELVKEGVKWGDNALDLVPGEEVEVAVVGEVEGVKARWYGGEEASGVVVV